MVERVTGLVLEVGVCGLGGSSVTSCGCAQEVSPDVKAHFAAKAKPLSWVSGILIL